MTSSSPVVVRRRRVPAPVASPPLIEETTATNRAWAEYLDAREELSKIHASSEDDSTDLIHIDLLFEAAHRVAKAAEKAGLEDKSDAEYAEQITQYRADEYAKRQVDFQGDPVRSFFTRTIPFTPEGNSPAYISRELPESLRNRLFRNIISNKNPVACPKEAFNHWFKNVMPKQIERKVVCNSTSIFAIENIRVAKPMLNGRPLWPYEARKAGLTYSGELIADIRVYMKPDLAKKAREEDPNAEISTIRVRDHSLMKIPIMLGCEACHLHGLTREERIRVNEDHLDPFGYFIIRGSERITLNQDNLAFAQMISAEYGDTIETRITFQGYNGSAVIRVFRESGNPKLYINVCQSGMKGNVTVSPMYPVYGLFDALLQNADPERFFYEYGEEDEGGGGGGEEVAVDVDAKRLAIVEEIHRLINLFIPPEHRKQVFFFLSASRTRYAAMRKPMSEILVRKSIRSMRDAIAQTATLSAADANARRAIFEYVSSGGEDEAIRDKTIVALNVKASANANRLSQRESVKTVMEDLFSDLFPSVELSEKPLHLARIVAQQCLVCIGVRPFHDRDALENKRVKSAAEWMTQLFNTYFRLNLQQPPGQSVYRISTDPLLSENIVSAFSTAAGNMKDNVVHMVKRDTQTALISQIAKIDAPASRQNKHFAPRLLHPSYYGFICIAETPSGEACGLTKTVALSAWNSFRRNVNEYKREIVNDIVRKATEGGYFGKIQTADKFVVAVIIETEIIGWVPLDRRFFNDIRIATKRNLKFFDVTIAYNRELRVIEIFLSGSRLTRPLFVVDVEAGGLKIDTLTVEDASDAYRNWTVEKLITEGMIEYLSAAEQQFIFLSRTAGEAREHVARRRKEIADGVRPNMDAYFDIYSEIDPVAIFGVQAALMPEPETCQGPRVNYQSNMIAQALGQYHSLPHERFDTAFKVAEGSRPTFESRIARPFGINSSRFGMMFLVAYVGLADNGEDGIIFKQEALERINMVKYSTHKATVRLPPSGKHPVGTVYEELGRPDEAVSAEAGSHRHFIYKNIDENGLPIVGTMLSKGMCVIGRMRVSVADDGEVVRTNSSVMIGVGEKGIVDRVDVSPCYVERNGVMEVVSLNVRVRIRDVRNSIPGDKFASRYSQKGTIAATRTNVGITARGVLSREAAAEARIKALDSVGGRELTEDAARDALRAAVSKEGYGTPSAEVVEDAALVKTRVALASTLPIINGGPNDGIVPDVFINPHSMPSRMTIGMLYEMLASAASLYTGERVDATAFATLNRDDIANFNETLESRGRDKWSEEDMIHPNGKKWREGVKAFVAPCFYQFLKHTVSDKIQYRSEGNVMRLTHQPVGGRSREGGLRIGEMEKSAIASWGAANIIRDRLMLASDAIDMEICANCGNQAFTDHLYEVRRCRVCKKGDEKIGVVKTTMAHLLITRMVNVLGIHPRLSHVRPSDRLPDF
jgi:DNA-directed RNA polymerase beta subunit